jgi:aminoglycoside 6'-N-acetyltransferase
MGSAVMTPDYVFRPMTLADLPLIQHWLMEPHVVQWWGDPSGQYDLVSGDLDEPAMDQFIVATAGSDFAIDQFIGEPGMVERGHGSAFIRAFVDARLREGAPRIVTDPDPANTRAVRAYQKAGFEKAGMVDTPDGPALLMVRNA